jgi:diguanylate cyclase (GGDEF)-like protein/PAS domain S-box-containing protein
MYMARSRDEDQVLGKSVPDSREFLENPAKTHGTYEVVAPVDGVARYYAWRRVGKLPLVLSIGLDKEAVLAPLRAEVRASLMRNSLVSAVLACAAFLVGWLSLQRLKAKAEATRHEELLHKLVTQVPGALFQLNMARDGARYFSYASPGLYALHRVERPSGRDDGAAILKTMEPGDARRLQAELRSAAGHLAAWSGHYRIYDSEGVEHWMRASARPERADDGGTLWHGYVQDVTQEHTMQEALRISEEHLRLTMAAVHDGVWQWDLTTDRVLWDARCWEMLGYPASAAELPRGTMLEWMHPSDQEGFGLRVAAHLERGEVYHSEFRLRTRSGGWLWVEARGNVTEREDGMPLRMLGTHTDVSERVAQAQMLRALLDESAAAIFLATRDRVVAQVNRRAQILFGRPGTSLVGQSLRTIHPDDASFEAFGACYSELVAHGFVRREWRFQLNDGSTRWHAIHGTLQDPQDPHGAVIWTIVDADDRHRAEAALRVAQRRLTAIIDRFPGGVMVQERLFGPIVTMNQAMCDLMGVDAPVTQLTKELEARVCALLPAEMLEQPEAPVPALHPRVLSVEQVLPDGRTYEVHRVPLWEGERSLGLFWMLRDITERKQRESVLERLAATDTLTTLPNRRTFMARVEQEWGAIGRHEQAPGVLIMLDIDFFKRVNDTWGHAVGDQVLKHLSALLRQRMRQGDLAGRLGGEEFAVLLSNTDLSGGMELAERMRAAIAQTPAQTEQGAVAFTISLGVCALDAGLASVDEGLARADAAMYHAKRHGRNRVTAWSPGLNMAEAPEQA